ncbi:hypothetical protein GGI12_004298, partial [Dipsacomyces acuminosporus]
VEFPIGSLATQLITRPSSGAAKNPSTRRAGPYEVLEKIGRAMYTLRKLDGSMLRHPVPQRLLKPYYPEDPQLEATKPPTVDSIIHRQAPQSAHEEQREGEVTTAADAEMVEESPAPDQTDSTERPSTSLSTDSEDPEDSKAILRKLLEGPQADPS